MSIHCQLCLSTTIAPLIRFEDVKARVAKYKEDLRQRIITECSDMVEVMNMSSAIFQDLELAADASEARTSSSAN
jgi:hypothetical protein